MIRAALLFFSSHLAAFPQNELVTFAGGLSSGFADGQGTNALFNAPSGADLCDTAVLVADTGNHRIRYVDYNDVVTTVAGTGTAGYMDGAALSAQFSSPYDIVQIVCDSLYAISDAGNHRIRLLDLSSNIVSTLSGGSTAGFKDGASALFNYPAGMAILIYSRTAFYLMVADMNNHAVRRVDSNGYVTTYFGNGVSGFVDGAGTHSAFSFPRFVSTSVDCRYVVGNYLCQYFVADTGNNVIRLLEMYDGSCPEAGCSGYNPYTERSVTSILSGSPTGANGTSDGDGTNANFNTPHSIGNGANGWMLVGDSGNRRIRGLTKGGYVGNVIGTAPVGEDGHADGTGTVASVSSDISDISLLPNDSTYRSVIVDRGNHILRRIVTASLSATPSSSMTASVSASFGTSPSTSPSPSLTPSTSPTASPTPAVAPAPRANSSSSNLQTNIAIGISLGCCVSAFGLLAWSYVKQPSQLGQLKKRPAPEAAPDSDEENIFGETALRAVRQVPPPNDAAAASALDDQLEQQAPPQFAGPGPDSDVDDKIVLWGSRPPRPSPSAGGAEKIVLGYQSSSASAPPVGEDEDESWVLSAPGGGASAKSASRRKADNWTLSPVVNGAAAGAASHGGNSAVTAEPNAGVGEPNNSTGDEVRTDAEAEKIVLSLERSRR